LMEQWARKKKPNEAPKKNVVLPVWSGERSIFPKIAFFCSF
jgi:hypothetical protein